MTELQATEPAEKIAGPVFNYVYASSAAESFSSQQLIDLLTKSRKNNTALGITGMLLYKDGNFLQVLEGPEAAVRETLAKIAADPRHHGILKLLQGPGRRQFSDWSMAFRDLNSEEAKATPGFSEFMNVSLAPQELAGKSGQIQKLLSMFRASMR